MKARYRLLIKRDSNLMNANDSCTREFTWPAWLMVVIVGVTMCLCFRFIFNCSPQHHMMSLGEVCWMVMAAFCNAGSTAPPQSTSSRILLITLYVLTILLHAFYNSFLISSLTINRSVLPFTNFEEMYDAKTYSFGLRVGTSLENFIKFSQIPLYKSIWEDMVLSDPENMVGTRQENVERILKEEKYATVLPDTFVSSNLQTCEYLVLPERFFKTPRAMAVQKNSPLLPVLSFRTVEIVESGIYARLRRKWEPETMSCETDKEPIDFLQTRTAFLLILFGLTLALVILGLEHLSIRWRRTQDSG